MKNTRHSFTQRGFTIIELLVVIAIISILAAIIFPVFAAVREKGRQTACVSNLRQIGQAFSMYAQDYNDQFALGGDPTDLQHDAWAGTPYENEVKSLKPLTEVLFPYTHSKQVWRCPSDIGFDMTGPRESIALSAHPSSFEQYGMSYYYRTSLALNSLRISTLIAWDPFLPASEHGSSEIGYLYDGSPNWHRGRYNALYVDGHVQNISQALFNQQWRMTFTRPQ